MKIGILTQPLHNNYGGLLQCYAMRIILKRMGHASVILRRVNSYSLYFRIKRFLYRSLKIKSNGFPYDFAQKISIHTNAFVEKYIFTLSPLLNSTDKLAKESNECEAFLVGSDQVWRPEFSPCIGNYFLDFTRGRKVHRVAYAASFGVDEWEFTDKQTEFCAPLARMFDAVSVREDSAVYLCRKYFGVEAVHVLDPTLLLEREDYEALVVAEREEQSEGGLFCYVLDESAEKQSLVKRIAEQTGLIPFNCMPLLKPDGTECSGQISDYIYPAPTRWLRSFMDAEMVFTDSFHGCVFSIIFNKPFWVIGNKERGMGRFTSLLSMFGLENRLIMSETFEQVDIFASIDWDKVNKERIEWQKKSMQFLIKALSGK